jgi:hypothetical protein
MGLSAAQGNYYYGSRPRMQGNLPGAGPEKCPQPVQGTRRVDSVKEYSGLPNKSPNIADINDVNKNPASWPPRGQYHERQPVWKGTQYVPPRVRSRLSGIPDPPSDGPQRPSLHQLFQNWSMWQGTDRTHYMDDLTRAYANCAGNANKPVLPVGQQDGTWTRINGGQPGFYRVYSRAKDDAGPGNDPVSVDVVGRHQPGAQYVYSGPPHGLHTQTIPDVLQSLQTRMASPQMRAVRQDRTSNSHYSGQSYSQTTQHQGGPKRPSYHRSRMGVNSK